MSTTPEGFTKRLSRLKADLNDQGRRVQALIEAAFDAAFARDTEAAQRVIDSDEEIDRVDVRIEKASVQLLADATNVSVGLPPDQLRMVLTIVKVNNELERIADAGVSIAEQVSSICQVGCPLPNTFRVMSNSVIGLVRDANAATDRVDPNLARVVLASEDTVEEFKRAVLRDVQRAVADGTMPVEHAFALQEIATFCEIMASHTTNVAEQIIYLATGAFVRHMHGHWEQININT